MYTEEQVQKLIDAAFAVASRSYKRDLVSDVYEEHMKWAARQFALVGFPTKPAGMSWGVLQEQE